jgi:hypothetical protein
MDDDRARAITASINRFARAEGGWVAMRHTFLAGRGLADVAANVIEGRLCFEPDDI